MAAEWKTECESVDVEFDRQYGAPGFALSLRARNHLAGCRRCRELYDYISAPSVQVVVPPEWSGKVENALKFSLKPVKPTGSTAGIAARLILLFLILAVSAISIMETAGLRIMTGGQLMGIAAALMASAVLLAVSLAWQVVPGSRRRVSPTTAIAVLGSAFALAVAVLFPWRAPDELVRHGWYCLARGTLMAIPAAALFVLLIRRGVAYEPGTLGATAGAIAGLLPVTILQATCNMQDAMHLLVWHGGVLAVSTGAGFLIGRAGLGFARRSG